MVSTKNSANKIITHRAKEDLASKGFRQKGHSRLWLKDEGLWLFLVEFQPTSRELGTFLNLSVMWLWNDKEYFSFDLGIGEFGARVSDFHRYVSDEQFDGVLSKLTARTLTEYFTIKEKLKTLKDIVYLFKNSQRKTIWDYMNAASAYALAQEEELARDEFKAVISFPAKVPYEIQLHERARSCLKLMESPEKLTREVLQTIQKMRKQFDLPELE